MHYRTIWLSDLHLGTKHSRPDLLLEFLKHNDSDYLYLVGDIVDGWQLKSKWHWHDDYNVLIQKLLRKSRKQTRVIYITGNHDEFLEDFAGLQFGSVTIARQVIHVGADGKRYLVLHGHQADGLTSIGPLLERVGSHLVRLDPRFQSPFQPPAPESRLRLLERGRLSQGEGEGGGRVYVGLRAHDRADGAARGRRRRDLRSYPPRRDQGYWRRALSQLRRLGGELHCARRGLRRRHHFTRAPCESSSAYRARDGVI